MIGINLIEDPRSDLIEDSADWVKILKRAVAKGEDLATLLQGFRCYGAKLTKIEHGYFLKARYAPDGGWHDEEEWTADRQKWLMPIANDLMSILGE